MNAGIWTPGLATCQPARPLPAVNFCGSQDFVSCFGNDGSTILAQLNAFATANGCTGTPVRSQLSSTSFCYEASGCPTGLDVRGCGIVGLPHCWPNFPGAGNTECQNQDPANLDASSYLLDFFSNLPAGSSHDRQQLAPPAPPVAL